MENEPPRRRVRRAKQSRPVAPGRADANAVGAVPVVPAAKPDVPPALPVDDQGWAVEEARDSSRSERDGAWLPAGITVLVMVSLLVCAGLVLIASRG